MRAMCASVLGFEAVVLGLSTPVMIMVGGVDKGVALAVGLGLFFATVAVTALLRYRFAYVAGTLLQLAAIGLGFLVPTMFVLGAIFASFWVAALVLGRRIEASRA